MQEIIIRAGCFIAIIILGYVLRKVHVFKESDFEVLSKILLKITLPAAIVSNFVGKEIDPSWLSLALLGIGFGVIHIVLAYVMNKKAGKESQALEMVNAGYNIGAFTMPFAQGFLGPMGVIATSLFDVGNAFVCLGGSLGLASIVKEGGKFSVKRIVKALVRSVAFDCYIIMVILSLTHITIPRPIVSFAKIVGDANAFVAMLMIGVGFKLSGDKTQIGRIVRILLVRYGVGAILAVSSYHLLPFPIEVRNALVILAFAPFPSSSPAYASELKGDVGLSSALNSMSIICSIILIVLILLFVI